MTAHHRPRPRWGFAIVALLVAAGCATTPTATPAVTASPTAVETANPTPTGPIASLPAGCAQEAEGPSTQPRVSIADVTTASYPGYDVLIFDFDRGLPEYAVTHVQPPFVRDPSGLPLDVQGSDFFSVVLRGASIVDEEFQPVYEGPTDLLPALPRIRQVVLAGDFEAVSSWLVGLEGPACLAVQAFDGKRLVIAFVDPR
jgi:hypothetical protein